MRQRLLIILAIIIVVVLVLTLTQSKPKSKIPERRAVAKEKTPTEKIPKVAGAEKPAPTEKEVKKQEKSIAQTMPEREEGWGEDPFVRDFSFITEIRDLQLTAITISESRSYALINNQIVGVGDEISGKKVIEIEKDKVVVEKGGRRFTIFLGQ